MCFISNVSNSKKCLGSIELIDHLVLKLPTGTKSAGAVLLGSGEVHVEDRDVAGGPLDLRSRHGEAVCGPQVT